MKLIWKYTLESRPGQQIVDLPVGSKILHFSEQNMALCIWIECEEKPEMSDVEKRCLVLAWTGKPMRSDMKYIGTTLGGSLVWHLYEAL